MKFFTILFATALLPIAAQAGELTYQFDLTQSKMDESTAFDLCGLPRQITLNAAEDLPTVVIHKMHAADPRELRIQFIQSTSGWVSGGDLQEPYKGDYRVRVALVKQSAESYPDGIFRRVEVVTYGRKSAPKAFTVEMEFLNYRDSAELGEELICTGFAYRLI